MLLKWDHIIHYIKNLEDFEFPDELLLLQPGGRHEALGTYNQLSYFDLSYVEFIDVFDESLVKQAAVDSKERLSFAATLERTHYKEGFKRLCFRTDDINALKDHFVSCGREVIGPNKMTRTKPDGQVISWQLLYIDDNSVRELPFFIQWDESDEDREQALMSLFQPLTVKEIALVSKDKERTITEWQDLFGATYDGHALTLPGSPAFTITAGDFDGIRSITIASADADVNEVTVHGATYLFT
ncbi:VOC family protein [Macrococcus equipercicus]|uniref:VOC family protein n=1 Tax=Macrococcus equipercicus TaxID=69967 RepID=A0A9Q9F243_9STAP|nr:VOC family protein [Macrococcus equipercicus]UTH13991.1 VOC family protein [Macrococcus equipercicus]